MIKRNLTLKNKFLFKFIFNKGSMVSGKFFNILFIKKFPAYVDIGSSEPKLFGITVSTRFSSKSVVRNHIRRLIMKNIQDAYEKFPSGYYVFIPKKNILGSNGKINVDAKEFSTEFNKVLSKMVFS